VNPFKRLLFGSGRLPKMVRDQVAGAVCVTDRRLLVWGARGKLVDLPRDDQRFGAIEVSAEEPDKVLFAWEASLFHDNRSGRVEVRLRPVQAERVVELTKA
jgi:hypothetical protein